MSAIINQLEKIERILYEFQQKSPEMVEFILSFLYQSNELEDLFQEMIQTKDLELATGMQLDLIGVLIGEFRNNRDDTSYRNAIKIRIGVNTSNGTIEDLITVLELLFGNDTDIIIRRDGSASITLFLGIEEPEEDLIPLIQQTIPAGVEISSILYSNNRVPYIPTERGATDISTSVLPERGVDLPSTPIPPERI